LAKPSIIVLVDQIESLILDVRGHKVVLDRDLAVLYGVETKALNRAVRRNADRFPPDFMFQVSEEEKEQILDGSFRFQRMKFASTRPYAFTEHGAIMAASVLSSPRAVEVSVFVVRAFVKLREFLSTHKEIRHKLEELERRVADHDGAVEQLFAAIRQLMEPPPTPPKRKIGFRP
jgi:hypothetical protein